MQITIYCASSARIKPLYFEATARLAKLLVAEGAEIVFGGGASGLMGHLADTVLAEGGRIRGIMPRFMHEVEWAHKGVSYFEFTDTMHERKARLLAGADGLIALPGGCGTFEELMEALTLKRLGLFTKPIVILNTGGYYDPLRLLLERSIEEGFMLERHRQMWAFADEPEAAIAALREAPAWDSGALHFARP